MLFYFRKMYEIVKDHKFYGNQSNICHATIFRTPWKGRAR